MQLKETAVLKYFLLFWINMFFIEIKIKKVLCQKVVTPLTPTFQ